MNFYEVFVRAPANGQAAGVLKAATGVEADIDRDELVFLIERLERKRRLLNKAIGITTKAQRKNLMTKINKGHRNCRSAIHPRGVDEWRRNGLALKRLHDELAARKRGT
jgi:hypothetical protein